MDVILLQSFVSLMLVGGAVLLFLYVHSARTFEHSERLALLPLEDAAPPPTLPSTVSKKDPE